ncbi:hypothetical protein DYD21_10895 [Rhodohalobacter sp. SW132]|uniref:hypothetical protein n=1 Tax=Rhodohalobacter sp. SW132 TaxID=2293433 RepID=UPI000E255D0E|nr:hypothetical protein [Rhodohalobacter sp. SW132]REL33281.1 hypothetical protein DYD21_10895 [Rhodohalobacter sp. SW132]
MKLVVSFVILSLLPLLLAGQPLKSNLSESVLQADAESETVHISDFISPVLSRSYSDETFDNSLQRRFTETPALGLLSSAILPGSGQMINNNWIRGGLFAAIEIASIYMIVEYHNRGNRGEQRYENFADQNWSVTQYAQWLVEYHDENGINNANLAQLRNMVEGIDPAFDTSVDWQQIDIDILRDVERNTPFITPDANRTSNFSHILPGYGSQQYYELISKYYQYQAGWADYYGYHSANNSNPYRISRDGDKASPLFSEGISLAEQFNEDFRTSKNFKMLLIANHVISAFDSFFTFQLKQNRLQAATSMSPASYIQLTYNF